MTDKEMASRLERSGWGVYHPSQYRIDIEKDFISIWDRVKKYTMTSLERGYALYKGVEYLTKRKIPGSFVECGVWKGGSCMLCAYAALANEDSDRTFYLYDTFTGMSEPSEFDRVAWNGRSVRDRWEENFASWAVSPEDVRNNMLSTGYPEDRIRLVKGKVEDTLREGGEEPIPESIALLRLDTDWYESTAVELDLLYPRLEPGGLLIIDDYGHFTGARKAVDDYFSSPEKAIFFARIDYTGRVGVKIS